MPKKKSPKKPGSIERSPRKEPYSVARLNTVTERIKEQVARMGALSRAIGDAKLDGIVIDGHAMLLRGLNQIDNFLDNASRAVREARTSKENY
jgi:hypothetical protein